MKRIFSLIITAFTLSLIPITVMAQSASELNAKALEFIHSEAQKDEDKKYEAALEVFDKLTRDYPNDFIGWYNKASAHAFLGQKEDAIQQREDAIQAVKKAVELKPDFAEAWYLYGQILSSGELAIECFDKAINSPEYIPGRDYLSLAWFNKGIAIYEYYKDDKKKYDEVINCINEGLGGRLLSAPNVVLATKAFLLFEMGRYADAITAAKSAVEWFETQETSLNRVIDPFTQGGLHNVIGLCYYKRGELEKALDAYVKAIDRLEQAPDPLAKHLLAGVWNNAGILYQIAGQYEEALGCYDQAMLTDESQPAAWVNKGYTLFRGAIEQEHRGNNERAREYRQKAFEVPLGSSEGLRREALDYLYTDEVISLVRLGSQNLRGYFFIRKVEQEGIDYPFFDSMKLYAANLSIINWREKIEESKPTILDSPDVRYRGITRTDDPIIRRRVIDDYQRGKDWALVIGINGYDLNRNRFNRLNFARRDAEEMYRFLRNEVGFEEEKVIPLYDGQATKEKIEEKLNWLAETTGENDRVIIFFSGHGTNTTVRDISYGYLVPIDGKGDSIVSTCISMAILEDKIRVMRAKHVLLVIDSCYSGSIGQKGGPRLSKNTWEVIEKLSKNPGRHAITAGRDDEIAIEKDGFGIFTGYLLDGLRGAADLDQNQVITLAELHAYVQNAVTKESKSQQVPQLIQLTSDSGEYVFIHPNGAR